MYCIWRFSNYFFLYKLDGFVPFFILTNYVTTAHATIPGKCFNNTKIHMDHKCPFMRFFLNKYSCNSLPTFKKNFFHTAQCKKPEITNVAESTKYEDYYNVNDSVEVKCKEGYGASHEKMTCTEGSKWNQTSQCIGEQMSNFPLLPPNVTPKMSNTDTYRTSLTPGITHKEAVQICLLCIPN